MRVSLLLIRNACMQGGCTHLQGSSHLPGQHLRVQERRDGETAVSRLLLIARPAAGYPIPLILHSCNKPTVYLAKI